MHNVQLIDLMIYRFAVMSNSQFLTSNFLFLFNSQF